MYEMSPVGRTDAEKVLAALSQLTGETWNLENVNVPLVDEKGVGSETEATGYQESSES